jgi:hypothetical protein
LFQCGLRELSRPICRASATINSYSRRYLTTWALSIFTALVLPNVRTQTRPALSPSANQPSTVRTPFATRQRSGSRRVLASRVWCSARRRKLPREDACAPQKAECRRATYIPLFSPRRAIWPRALRQLRASGLTEAIVSIRAAYLREVAGLLERYPNWSSANRRCSPACSFARECLCRADHTAADRDCRILRGRSR